MYNTLSGEEFQVRLERRNVYQAVALGIAQQIASEREQCPQLTNLPDEVYAAGMKALEAAVDREGEMSLVSSEFCLVEVTAMLG